MRKMKIKRVFLVDDMTGNSFIYGQEFFGTLSDYAILCAIHEIGKTVWIGRDLYHIVHMNGQIRRLRYEIHTLRVSRG